MPLLATGTTAASIHVWVEIDYGTQEKQLVKKSILLKPGSTVVDATKRAVGVTQGFVCCNPKDVESIDGVKCDAEKGIWWLYEINGKKGQVSACRYLLEDGDCVTWRYCKVGRPQGKPVSAHPTTIPVPGS